MKQESAHQILTTDQRQKLVALRHEIHRNPEISFEEHDTAKRLERALTDVGLEEVRRVTETGIVARVPGTIPDAPVVAIRGDMDALPIQEETGVEFSSANPGVMHACGHDVHSAWTVGAAHLLAAHPPHGDIIILLQPAEETGRGAAAMIDAGALDGVSAIFGGHVDMRFEVGEVVAQPGSVAASADDFTIELTGHGSHAARPHEGNDPIVAAAALICTLQTIVSRRLAPGTPAVVTVAVVEAGSAYNIIPNLARLSGTIRAANYEIRTRLEIELKRCAAGIASAHDMTAHVSVRNGTPPLVNETKTTAWAQEAIRDLLGDNALVTLPEPNLGGEDFACYLEQIDGSFLRIGARNAGQAPVPAHTSRFLPADESIFVGAAVLAATARRASAESLEAT